MKIKTISPIGATTPLLFDTFDSLSQHGYSFVDSLEEADVVWFDCHDGDHAYQIGKIGMFADVVATIVESRKPMVVFNRHDCWGDPGRRCNWFGWDNWAGLRSDEREWARIVNAALDHGLVKLMFVRNMQRSRRDEYPFFVRPFELILEPDHRFEPATFEQYSQRPFDACFIGCSSPWRATFICSLIEAGFKIDWQFPYERIPHDAWLQRHRQAKFFIECCGHFGSDRPFQLSYVAPQLKLTNDQLWPVNSAWPWERAGNPLTDPFPSFIEIGNYDGTLSRGSDINALYNLFRSPEECYRIYRDGIKFMEANHTAEARANYVAEQMRSVGL